MAHRGSCRAAAGQNPARSERPRRIAAAATLLLAIALPGFAASSYYTVRPCRLADTRWPAGPLGGPSLSAGTFRTFNLTNCGISPTAAAAALNVTVVAPGSPGFLKLYPAGTPAPNVSAINFRAGQSRANNAIAPLSAGALVNVAVRMANGTVDLVIDVNGYFDDPAHNQPPTVDAGPDQTITLPDSANLNAVASDDGKPSGTLAYSWAKVSGPGIVQFVNANAASTAASFDEAGSYVLSVTVSDGSLSMHDAVKIDVNPFPGSNPSEDQTRFLEQATWGPTLADRSHLQAIGMVAWLDEQFHMPASSYPTLPLQPTVIPVGCSSLCQLNNYTMYPLQRQFFTNAMYGTDQLRQRVAFALHQLVVVSGNTVTQPSWMAPYLQVFDRNAFGNYRQLLYEMTLNPAMGDYLDMIFSTQNNPNENYARELMQLFSIGVYRLNIDGTLQLDGTGNPIPNYDQDAVTGLAHVFTGWTLAPKVATNTPDYITPLPFNSARHDAGSKTIIDGIVVPAGQTGPQDLNQAIDALFYHPNVGPYLATHLIHNLVTSNPSPGYVQRVAEAFNDNGIGVRGDMQAVITAVLLDSEARGDVITTPEYGHLKQPVLFLANLLRAFGAKSADLSTTSDGYLNPQTRAMGQDVFNPTNVFSYYPAEFETPGWSPLLGPEFGIFSATEALRRANVVNTLVFATIPVSTNAPRGTALDFSPWLPLAANPAQLVSQLNDLMLQGSMSASMQTSIVNAVNAVATTNARLRVQQAVYLVATSSQYSVVR